MKIDLKFHVGLAPYIDAYGAKRASYQALNQAGRAVATVSMRDEAITQLSYHTPQILDVGAFIAMARRFHVLAQPIVFAGGVT